MVWRILSESVVKISRAAVTLHATVFLLQIATGEVQARKVLSLA